MGNTDSTPRKLLYCVPVPTSEPPQNETHVFRHPHSIHSDLFQTSPIKTLQETYTKRFKGNPQANCFARRRLDSAGKPTQGLEYFSNGWVLKRAEAFGSGLLALGLVPELREWNDLALRFCGVYAKNCLEYFLQDIACCIYGITSIPIYDTLGEEATLFAFNQTKMTTCALTANHVTNILRQQRENGSFQFLRNLIVFDPQNLPPALQNTKEAEGIRLFSFEEVAQKGAENIRPWAEITPETIYCFSYTSGTTGEPKGAMISHRSICGIFAGAIGRIRANASDSIISYLPMAHSLERLAFNVMLYSDCLICIYSGDVQKLKEDLAVFQPTLFLTVPRLFNKIYDGILVEIRKKSALVQKLFRRAVRVKLENLKKDCAYTHALYDKLVFNKMKGALGGRVRLMLTGSAPIADEVISFLKIAFCCPILEGYGQTEAMGAELTTLPFDPLAGHVGGPMLHNELKLVDVPEMNYTTKDTDESGRPRPRGEIWVRGPNVIPGYYKLDEKNKETFTSDGWLMSGDVGMIEGEERRVKIIDRKKNIFKLAQGEYIAPEKLENIYKLAHPLISAIYVYGDSLKSCIVAVLNMEGSSLSKFAEEQGITQEKVSELAKSKAVKKKLIELLDAEAKKAKLNPLEKVKAVHIETTGFGELKLLTEAFKLKRVDVREYYKGTFDELYKELEP